MKSDSENSDFIFINPIDEIEEIVHAYEFKFSRNNNFELIVNYGGLWTNYEVSFSWLQPKDLIRINTYLYLKIPIKIVNKLQVMISLINENTTFGYFGYSLKKNCLYFRYNISMRGVNNLTTEQIEDFIDVMIHECDKYYPAFQVFIHKKSDPQFALDSTLLETAGKA